MMLTIDSLASLAGYDIGRSLADISHGSASEIKSFMVTFRPTWTSFVKQLIVFDNCIAKEYPPDYTTFATLRLDKSICC
jgi:hypothetical protein